MALPLHLMVKKEERYKRILHGGIHLRCAGNKEQEMARCEQHIRSRPIKQRWLYLEEELWQAPVSV